MSDFKIEKGIVYPKKHFPTRKNYPWNEMEVGDSIFVPVPSTKKASSLQAELSTNSRMWAKYNDKDWVFRQVKEGEGFRIWRVK